MPAWLVVFLVTIGYLLASLAIGLASGRHASAAPRATSPATAR